jgi:hypothetical protein
MGLNDGFLGKKPLGRGKNPQVFVTVNFFFPILSA